MCTRRVCAVLAVTICSTLASALPRSMNPHEQSVTYTLREIPTDPTSAVRYVITLHVLVADEDGAWLGWEVLDVEFRQPGDNGSPDRVWTETLPFVETADGLWWIEHTNPELPILDEFLLPPRVYGTAVPSDPADADLDYDVEGAAYVSPPEGDPYETTSALSYTLAVVAEPPKEEPVEPGGVRDPH